MKRKLVLLAAGACVGLGMPRVAAANHCDPLSDVFSPGVPGNRQHEIPLAPPDPVGRSCSILFYQGEQVRIDEVRLRWSGGPMAFSHTKRPEPFTMTRKAGCYDEAELTVEWPVFELVPDQPLPPNATIQIIQEDCITCYDGTGLAQTGCSEEVLGEFTTTDVLDAADCHPFLPPDPGPCTPDVATCSSGEEGIAGHADDREAEVARGCSVSAPPGGWPAVLVLLICVSWRLRRYGVS